MNNIANYIIFCAKISNIQPQKNRSKQKTPVSCGIGFPVFTEDHCCRKVIFPVSGSMASTMARDSKS